MDISTADQILTDIYAGTLLPNDIKDIGPIRVYAYIIDEITYECWDIPEDHAELTKNAILLHNRNHQNRFLFLMDSDQHEKKYAIVKIGGYFYIPRHRGRLHLMVGDDYARIFAEVYTLYSKK